MYRHPIIVNMLYKLWFAKMGESDGIRMEAFFYSEWGGNPIRDCCIGSRCSTFH